MKTKICDLFEIKYPIVQGALQWLSVAEFAAAASNAGGLGIISAATQETKPKLIEEIRKMKRLTNNPFAVNISMLPVSTHSSATKDFFDAVVEEKVPIVETSGRNPEEFIPMLKKAGIKIMHKVPAARFARKAESIGVDAVTIVGCECGGHPGMDDVPGMILIPATADSLKVPVIAGGGIADARGLVAALALGADGVMIGTRFVATKECPIHQNFKDWIINARETDTVLIQRSIKNVLRAMKNQAAAKVLELERNGAGLPELMPLISGKVGKACYINGDLQGGIFTVGQSAALINEIKTVKEVIEDIMAGAENILKKLGR